MRIWKEIQDRERFLEEEGADVKIIVNGGGFPLRPAFLDRLPNLSLIACLGSGYEALDLHNIRQRGIELSYAPSTNHDDVADVAIGLMIAAIRRFPQGDSIVRLGKWKGPVPLPMSPSLRDLRYGIAGLGAIGTAIAHRLEGFGGTIRWWGPRPKPDSRWPKAESLLDLADNSDVLLLALRADTSNTGCIDAEIIDALGPHGYLINVARGSLVDEEALAEALRTGRLAGAGLDVFSPEPASTERWRDVENAALTPHIGGWARGSFREMEHLLSANIRNHLVGQPLVTPIPAG